MGWVWYYVEVQNTSARNVSGATFTLAMINQDNVVVATDTASPMVDILRPGEISPMEFFFSFPPGWRKIREHRPRVTLDNATFTDTDTRWGLELVSHESYVDDNGIRHVTGQIRNVAAVALSNPRAIVSIIGNESWANSVITAKEQIIVSGSLPAAARASFDASVGRTADGSYSHYGIVLEHD